MQINMFHIIIGTFFASYIIFASRRRNIFYCLLPFFFVVSIPIFRAGLLNTHTYVFRGTDIFQSLIDMILNIDLLKNDEAMQFMWQIYPKGYLAMISPLVSMGVSFPIIAKFTSLLAAIIIPALIYYLAIVIYVEKRIAYFAALFSYIIIPSYPLLLSGWPATVGFLLYLLTLSCLFKFMKSGSLASFLCTAMCMLAISWTHLVSFYFLIIPLSVFLIFYLIRNIRNGAYPIIKVSFLWLIMSLVVYFWFINYHPMRFSSQSFVMDDRLLSINDSYFLVSFWGILGRIGIFPIILLFLFIIFRKSSQKQDRHHFQGEIFTVSIFLLAAAYIISKFDGLFFLLLHRYPPFIALFFYLTGIPLFAEKLSRPGLKNKIVIFIIIVFSLIPVSRYLYSKLNGPLFPYGFYRTIPEPLQPKNLIQDDIKIFNELVAVSDYIKYKTPVDAVVATPMWYGDLIRIYSKRSVTSSLYTGGFAAVYGVAGDIFQDHVINSQKMGTNPDYLFDKYKATYFVFYKGEFKQLSLPSVEIFSTDNFKVIKII